MGGLAALPACKPSGSKLDAEVIILGAGLAGLNAARLLAAAGKDVLVLEGSSRIGGRIQTINHGKLGYTEGGADKIKASYSRIIQTANELGVDLIPSAEYQPETLYHYQGANYSRQAWSTITSPLFPAPFGASAPASPLFELAAQNNPLKSNHDWLDPKFSAFDISAQDFLLQAGFGGDAQKIMEKAFDGNSLRSYSMMNLYRALIDTPDAKQMKVKDGAQHLPEAMAASLPRKVKLDHMVSSISVETESVQIETTQGNTYRASFCICAMPFGALRNVTIRAFMPEAQTAAIRELPYTQILQIHLKAKIPFWDKDGLPADMWTDLPVERILAERDTNGKPTGLFRVLINGRGATRSIWQDRAKIKERVTAYMKTVRPSSEGLFELLAIQDWTKANPFAGGAYMHWAPRQISQWSSPMAMPSSKLAFAGEHVSRIHTGMEGAMESGEIAAAYLQAR